MAATKMPQKLITHKSRDKMLVKLKVQIKPEKTSQIVSEEIQNQEH